MKHRVLKYGTIVRYTSGSEATIETDDPRYADFCKAAKARGIEVKKPTHSWEDAARVTRDQAIVLTMESFRDQWADPTGTITATEGDKYTVEVGGQPFTIVFKPDTTEKAWIRFEGVTVGRQVAEGYASTRYDQFIRDPWADDNHRREPHWTIILDRARKFGGAWDSTISRKSQRLLSAMIAEAFATVLESLPDFDTDLHLKRAAIHEQIKKLESDNASRQYYIDRNNADIAKLAAQLDDLK